MITLTPEIFGVELGSVCISDAVGMLCGRHQLPPAHQCQTQFGAADVGRDNLEPDVANLSSLTGTNCAGAPSTDFVMFCYDYALLGRAKLLKRLQ